MIEVENLTKKFGDLIAVDAVTFRVEEESASAVGVDPTFANAEQGVL